MNIVCRPESVFAETDFKLLSFSFLVVVSISTGFIVCTVDEFTPSLSTLDTLVVAVAVYAAIVYLNSKLACLGESNY